ncbi:conserved hypothetical protein [Trichinella spiralis]|uniref:hypothetical protein n=1 Tax=Trichinella spiralis TaxID=6334 RepID=UPI0001EFD90C|nr:conserved hypothetical protein [Trichinella spiralis]
MPASASMNFINAGPASNTCHCNCQIFFFANFIDEQIHLLEKIFSERGLRWWHLEALYSNAVSECSYCSLLLVVVVVVRRESFESVDTKRRLRTNSLQMIGLVVSLIFIVNSQKCCRGSETVIK